MKFEKKLKEALKVSDAERKEGFDKLSKRINLNSIFCELLFADIKDNRINAFEDIINAFEDISYASYLDRIKNAGHEVLDEAGLLRDMQNRVESLREEFGSIENMKEFLKLS